VNTVCLVHPISIVDEGSHDDVPHLTNQGPTASYRSPYQGRRVPEISDSIRAYISAYRPAVIDDDTWAAVGPELREAMLRAGTWARRTCARCARRSAATSGAPRPTPPVAMADALHDDAIDQFYLRGMSDLGGRTRNDYRSLLHRLAARVSRRPPWRGACPGPQ